MAISRDVHACQDNFMMALPYEFAEFADYLVTVPGSFRASRIWDDAVCAERFTAFLDFYERPAPERIDAHGVFPEDVFNCWFFSWRNTVYVIKNL